MAKATDLNVEIIFHDTHISSYASVDLAKMIDLGIISSEFDVDIFMSKLEDLNEMYRGKISFIDHGPIIKHENGNLRINEKIFLNWEDNSEVKALITCSSELPESNVGWWIAWPNENENVSEYCNQFLSILHPFNGSIRFYWEVSGEEGYDSYSILHNYNKENKYPISKVFYDFYED